MENSFQTSFIPKKPIASAPSAAPLPVSRSVSILSLIATGALILVGLLAGAFFLYRNYLTNQKQVLSTSLARAKDSFEKDTITELETFDRRVSASKKILASHIVLSPLFTVLGDITIPSIQYTKFEHQFTDKGLFYVKMTGIARDYKSIATQSDIFNGPKGRYLKSVVFSNLTLSESKDKKGMVGFNVEFIVDPVLLSYDKNIILEKNVSTQAGYQAGTPSASSNLPIPQAIQTDIQPVQIPIPQPEIKEIILPGNATSSATTSASTTSDSKQVTSPSSLKSKKTP